MDPTPTDRRGERLIGVFLLAVLLFSPVVVGLFARPALPLGVPLLVLYVFGAWAAVIVLLARIAHRRDRDDGGGA